MPQGEIDLRRGSILHIKDFATRGHAKRHKFVLIIGKPTDSEVLGFLISSQLSYLQQDSHKKEVVRIPQNAMAVFRVESIIQCFTRKPFADQCC